MSEGEDGRRRKQREMFGKGKHFVMEEKKNREGGGGKYLGKREIS